MSDRSPAPPASEAGGAANFEQSLSQLQQIVHDLEDGRLGLEESLQRFEQGVGLLRRCYQVLEQAEQKIEILTGFDADGNPVTKPFDGSATFRPAEQTAGRRKSRRGGGKSEPAPAEPTEDEAPPERGKRLF